LAIKIYLEIGMLNMVKGDGQHWLRTISLKGYFVLSAPFWFLKVKKKFKKQPLMLIEKSKVTAYLGKVKDEYGKKIKLKFSLTFPHSAKKEEKD